jgi:hypothetical protein
MHAVNADQQNLLDIAISVGVLCRSRDGGCEQTERQSNSESSLLQVILLVWKFE